jgi:hypothetical protein
VFSSAETFMYCGGDHSVTIAQIESGYRPATNSPREKKKGRIHVADGEFLAATGGTPDHTALLWIEDYLKNVQNTVLIHICDGGPNDSQATRIVADSLYQKGMRYATIIVGGGHYASTIYPADISVSVSPRCRPGDWQKIESILDYALSK